MTRQTTTRAGGVLLIILATVASCDRPSTNGDDQPSTSTGQTDPLQLPFPEEIIDPPWLESRRQAQLATAEQFNVFCDFAFSDRLEDSAIRFRNRITPDSGRDYRPNHYDHGNGMAIADVDGDGLYDIYFVTQVGDNELWRNLGGGKFEDITQRAGVAAKSIGVSASFADIDNDGDPDLYVTVLRRGNILFENDGTGTFKDISQDAGLDYKGHPSAAVFFDYNGDGLLDIFLTVVGQYTTDELKKASYSKDSPYKYYAGFNDGFSGHLKPERTETSILFKNEGDNRFVDVSEKVGLQDESWAGAASPIDVNEDGWPRSIRFEYAGARPILRKHRGQTFCRQEPRGFSPNPLGGRWESKFSITTTMAKWISISLTCTPT